MVTFAVNGDLTYDDMLCTNLQGDRENNIFYATLVNGVGFSSSVTEEFLEEIGMVLTYSDSILEAIEF